MITDDFAAYAVGADLHLSSPATGADVRSRMEDLMVAIAKECDRAGSTLIGHIKSMVETDGKGFLSVSVTEPEGRPSSRGELQDGIMEMDIVINVLLYGLTRARVRELVDPLALKILAFPGATVELEDLEEHHHHHHDDDEEHHHEHGEHDHDHC